MLQTLAGQNHGDRNLAPPGTPPAGATELLGEETKAISSSCVNLSSVAVDVSGAKVANTINIIAYDANVTRLVMDDVSWKRKWIKFKTFSQTLLFDKDTCEPTKNVSQLELLSQNLQEQTSTSLFWSFIHWIMQLFGWHCTSASANLMNMYMDQAAAEVVGGLAKPAVQARLENVASHFNHSSFAARYVKRSTIVGGKNCTRQGVAPAEQPSPGRKAIFILGPSASGKTFSTALYLRALLRLNEWNENESYLTIDGGVMREQSYVWTELKKLADLYNDSILGFQDVFDTMFKPSIDEFKKQLEQDAVAEGWNLILPLTAPTCGLGSSRINTANIFGFPCKDMKQYWRLKENGYNITFMTLNVDLVNVQAMGKKREVKEGKRYSPNAYIYSVRAAANIMNTARRASNPNTFLIIENNENRKLLKWEERGQKVTSRKSHVWIVDKNDYVAVDNLGEDRYSYSPHWKDSFTEAESCPCTQNQCTQNHAHVP